MNEVSYPIPWSAKIESWKILKDSNFVFEIVIPQDFFLKYSFSCNVSDHFWYKIKKNSA